MGNNLWRVKAARDICMRNTPKFLDIEVDSRKLLTIEENSLCDIVRVGSKNYRGSASLIMSYNKSNNTTKLVCTVADGINMYAAFFYGDFYGRSKPYFRIHSEYGDDRNAFNRWLSTNTTEHICKR